jgi:hypothetical protein
MTWRQSGFSCGSRGFGFSPIQAGGSLAGKDSSDASSTGSVSGDGGCGGPASGGEGVRVGAGLVTGQGHLTPFPPQGTYSKMLSHHRPPEEYWIEPAGIFARSRNRTRNAGLHEPLQEFIAQSGSAAGGRSGAHAGASAGATAADLPFPTAFSMAANSSAERMGLGR